MKQNIHRIQISKAFEFFRKNHSRKITLEEISKKCGASQYHFIRIFNAYTGETPFNFLRRERVVQGMIILNETNFSVTDIAFKVGFDASSSFNKAFKKLVLINPSEFRNLGKEKRKDLIYSVSMTPKTKEIVMNFNMNLEPEIITRDETIVYCTSAEGGDFKDVAPIAWDKFLQIIPTLNQNLDQSEFLGIGSMDVNDTRKVCNYKAALSMPKEVELSNKELEKIIMPQSRYAKFLLKGSYDNIWIGFDKAFEVIGNMELELAELPCVENYLNDPQITPVEELLTEILIPIK